jgi:multidrug efflux system outer membrane protein
VITLVADVASTYLFLRELDLQLDVARRTVHTNDETVQFYEKRLKGGVSNRLELDTATANRARTAVVIPQLEQQIAVTENALSLLLGRPPGPIPRGEVLSDQHVPPEIPVGLPAALLERRPDVLGAEQQLVAANANVGAAKALFFPTISLTGLLGTLSMDFSNLLKADANVWQVSPGLFQPLFQGGRIRRNYDAAKARFEQALAQYQKAALNSYREVANALVTVKKLGEARLELEDGVEALTDAAALARSRYDTGLASYLEILTADQQLFDQELQLAQVRGEEMRAFVELYRALGGGWQSEPAAAGGPAPTTSAPPPTPPSR